MNAPTKKHVSLKAMAEDKNVDAVSKITNFLMDPAAIEVRPGFNPRPINRQHVEEMYEAWTHGAQFDPLVVDVEDGHTYVVAGHHRREMYLLARERGHDIRRVEVRQFKGTEADRIALTITSQQGLALTQLQLGGQYRKLENLGNTVAEVAARIGKTAQHVRDCLMLEDADPKTKALLEAGKVSPDVARAAIRQHGADAGKVLEADLARVQGEAEANGDDPDEAKVTPKNASTKAPTKLQRALDLLESLRDTVEALEGTSVENEKIVDEYNKLMGPRPEPVPAADDDAETEE